VKKSIVALSVLSVLLLSGCNASVETTLDVTSEQSADITVSATFQGDAFNAIPVGSDAEKQLVAAFERGTGNTPTVTRQDDTLTVAAPCSYDKLTTLSNVTGVSSAVLSGAGESVTLKVKSVEPTKIKQSIEQTLKGQPDSDQLTQTMLEQTNVKVSVSYPGGISGYKASDGNVSEDGNQVTWTRAATAKDGTFNVTGSVQSLWWKSKVLMLPVWLWLSLLALGFSTVILSRRKMNRS
jgi:hypothetical protein